MSNGRKTASLVLLIAACLLFAFSVIFLLSAVVNASPGMLIFVAAVAVAGSGAALYSTSLVYRRMSQVAN